MAHLNYKLYINYGGLLTQAVESSSLDHGILHITLLKSTMAVYRKCPYYKHPALRHYLGLLLRSCISCHFVCHGGAYILLPPHSYLTKFPRPTKPHNQPTPQTITSKPACCVCHYGPGQHMSILTHCLYLDSLLEVPRTKTLHRAILFGANLWNLRGYYYFVIICSPFRRHFYKVGHF